MSTASDKAAEARRRLFEKWNHDNARWGRFSVADLGNPIRCGVCGLEYLDQMAKADHLRHEHGADVWIVAGTDDQPLYEWHRP